ncbi:streptococcal hemagglutinin-like [Haliotis asinina]|uniref:streptococcal hemagglutinin-like n=1 Tax=Haliotis asinina TaxID=109174 RepID=UPI003532493A
MSVICHRILLVSLLWLHWLHVAECSTVVVTCSSNAYAYTECSIPSLDDNSRVMNVTKKKQLSRSACTRTVSFGYTETKMWVSEGCRAEFYVQFGIVEPPSSSQDSIPASGGVMSTVLETSTADQFPSSRGLVPAAETWSTSSREDITPSLQHLLTPSRTHTATPWTPDVSPYDMLSTSNNLSATLVFHDGSSLTGFLSQTASVAPLASASWSDVSTTTSVCATQAISSSTNKVLHADSFVWAKSARTCYCMKRAQTESVVNRNDYIKQIVEKLQVNVETLSKTVRKKTSAKDDRPLSVSMGYLGIAFLVLTALLIVLPDVCTLCNINNT